LKTELAGAVVATVWKLVSLPLRNRVKALEVKDDVDAPELWYIEDAADDGCEWFRQLGTVVALLRTLNVPEAGLRS
jgi:hypothetical protein